MELETNLGSMPEGQVVAAHWSVSKPMKYIGHEKQKSGVSNTEYVILCIDIVTRREAGILGEI